MLRPALAAALLVAAAVPAVAAGQAQDVKVGATPPDAEVTDQRTIPIIRSGTASNEGSRVVMRLKRSQGDLPGLAFGDRLKVMAELQVTTADSGYSYAPHARARLLLTRNPDARVADGVSAVRLGDPAEQQCSRTVHHCVLVFRNIGATVGTDFADPCASSSDCFVNVVANAWHPDANANGNHRLLIGENEPDGSVKGDKGSVGVVRIRPGTATGYADVSAETSPAGSSYPVTDNLEGDRYVVFRKNIGQPALGDEFSYDFMMQTNPTAPFPIRVSTQVIVAGSPGGESPVGDVYPDSGKVSRFNGENCLAGTLCTTRHVGVFRALRSFGQDLWLVVLAKSAAPFDDAGNSRYAVDIPSGRLEVTRYRDAD